MSNSEYYHDKVPLVTVIIVNYNFKDYLLAAIDSVYRQTYQRIECIFIDNASTDGSLAVVRAAQEKYKDLIFIQMEQNDGQTAASIDGVSRARGQYIVFLDADDTLLPHCVAVHVRVHLSARLHVGFTCGQILQVVDGNVVVTGYAPMAKYICDNRPSPRLLPDEDPDVLCQTVTLPERMELRSKVYLVNNEQPGWVWSPISALCFRKDALDLFCDNEAARALTSQTDLYLCLGINAVTGSILIDEPVATYRLHGTNVFSTGAQLNGRLSYDPQKAASMRMLGQRLLIDHFLGHIDRFVQEPHQLSAFLMILRRLDVPAPKPKLLKRSYLSQRIKNYRGSLKKVLGSIGSAIVLLFVTGDAATAADLIWNAITR